jgi:hypothetical protein
LKHPPLTSSGEPKKGAVRACLIASAVLHADIALGTDVEPRLKPILEGHRRHIEVISQALQTEIPSLFHAATMRGIQEELQ